MNLIRKVVLALLVGFLLVLSANEWLGVRRQAELLDLDARRDHLVLGHALARELGEALVEKGMAVASARAAATSRPPDLVQVRWLSLEGPVAGSLSRDEQALVRSGQDVSKRVTGKDGKPDTLLSYIPIPVDRRYAIELAEPLAQEQQLILHTIRNAVFGTLALLLVTGTLAAVVGVHFVSRPIEILLDKIRRVAAGDLTGDLHLRQQDELGEIAGALNEMSAAIARTNEKLEVETQARLAAVEQLRHADRLMTVGKLASGLAHELGTPLSVVSGRAEMLLLGETADRETRDTARIIRDQTHRMATIISQLLDFARKHRPQKRRADVRSAVEKAVTLLTPLADKRGVQLEIEPSTRSTEALVDEGQIQQVLTNLIANSLQATPSGGRVTVEVDEARGRAPADVDIDPGRTIRVAVKDTGTGMTREVAARIFEPFFTTKEVGEGTGLGLSVTYGIVREHGGWIDVESALGRGSTFSVYLPVSLPTAGEESA